MLVIFSSHLHMKNKDIVMLTTLGLVLTVGVLMTTYSQAQAQSATEFGLLSPQHPALCSTNSGGVGGMGGNGGVGQSGALGGAWEVRYYSQHHNCCIHNLPFQMYIPIDTTIHSFHKRLDRKISLPMPRSLLWLLAAHRVFSFT
jgi:hypothetical protein